MPLLFALIVAGAVLSAGAFGHGGATPTVTGNATAGKSLFTSSGCSSCHTLAAAKAKGKVGPSLDTESLTEAKIITQINVGGYGVMGAAAKKQYPFPMSGYKGKLSTTVIQNIAAFIVTKRTGGTPAPVSTSTTTSTTASSSSSSSSSTASSGGAKTVGDGCPAGTTIATSGSTDNDGDENGDPTDGDGCI